MDNLVNEAYKYANITASQNVLARAGGLTGIFVANGSGTIAVYDSNATSTTNKIVDSFSVTPGVFYPLPFLCASGLYLVLTGTMNITVALSGT